MAKSKDTKETTARSAPERSSAASSSSEATEKKAASSDPRKPDPVKPDDDGDKKKHRQERAEGTRHPGAGRADEPLPGGDEDDAPPAEPPEEIPVDADGNVNEPPDDPSYQDRTQDVRGRRPDVNSMDRATAREKQREVHSRLSAVRKDLEKLKAEERELLETSSLLASRAEQLVKKMTPAERYSQVIARAKQTREERAGRFRKAPVDEAFSARRGFGTKRPKHPALAPPDAGGKGGN